MAVVKITDDRKDVLEKLVKSEGKKSEIGQRAQVILLAAAGSETMTISQRVGLSMNRVRSALQVWRQAEGQLAVAERKGKPGLRTAIRSLFERFDDGCCCGCEDQDEEFGLDREELDTLARKVFELINYELRIERERIGYFA